MAKNNNRTFLGIFMLATMLATGCGEAPQKSSSWEPQFPSLGSVLYEDIIEENIISGNEIPDISKKELVCKTNSITLWYEPCFYDEETNDYYFDDRRFIIENYSECNKLTFTAEADVPLMKNIKIGSSDLNDDGSFKLPYNNLEKLYVEELDVSFENPLYEGPTDVDLTYSVSKGALKLNGFISERIKAYLVFNSKVIGVNSFDNDQYIKFDHTAVNPGDSAELVIHHYSGCNLSTKTCNGFNEKFKVKVTF